MEPFRIEVSDEALADLQARLDRTRYSPGITDDWRAGMPTFELRALVDRWRDGYDWRAQEQSLNAYPQFTAEVNGLTIHFVHLLHPNLDAPAIVLTHGWPYTFAEMLDLADRLAPDFSVIVPSLPGFVFSSASDSVPVHPSTMAPVWNRLLTETLGYDRYLLYGEDVGAGLSDWIAALYPERVAGIIAPHPAFPPDERRDDLAPEETAFFAWLDGVWEGGKGYSEIQSTKPDTLAAGLSDSPAGLAARVLEKFHEWSDDATPWAERFDRDRLLTTVMLFWITDSIGSSFRAYWDDGVVGDIPLPLVTVPAAILVQQHEREFPRSVAERTYTDIRSFRLLDRGGHFTALEAPDDVATTIRELATEVGLL